MTQPRIYILNNGEKGVEENRLTYQHGLFLKMTKTLIPSKIKSHLTSLGRVPAVADIGAGTGIWLRDLAAELPNESRLDGYDVDQSKFLPSQDLPSNVKLSFGEVFEPFPQGLIGQYDLVHVRLLMFALKADQWVSAAENLRTLLRPGGYLVWDETGFTSFNCIPMTETFQKWISTDERYGESVGRDVLSPMRLQGQLEEAGYVECSHEDFNSYSEPHDVRKMASNAIVNIARQSLHGIVGDGGFEWAQAHKQVDQHIDQLQSESDSGTCTLGFEIRWTMGRNPIS
ncbi:methyltransferase domain-containing [Fusarium albosuccineum]|uniref:Methyltransferase domain-containing n=1 Tax=Fusarium albosuccineum TaxID=1237068 RepID=A0A8H4L8E4_9HYPO|nr:methyltransferase domain-containing [Fusarium albosuccineum]